jgi:L-ascorbate metabolism protein UlaG (beta-lactamase superfamily)
MPRFENVNPAHRRPNAWEVFRWAFLDRLTGRRIKAPPGEPADRTEPDPQALAARDGEVRLTWIGHASFLMSLAGVNLLVDPVFSKRIGWLYRRYGEPGLLPEQLPQIDALLVTHSHYDHLDAASIAAIPRRTTVICPVGLGGWFRSRKFETVVELDWWERFEAGAVTITFVPSRHWTQRSPFDFNRSRWGGYVLESNQSTIYHAGDSAWFDGFAEIGRRYSNIDVALMPIGAYAPAWFMERNHMTPEQAGEAFLLTGAKRMLPMHWGTFQLTDEPLQEPRDRLIEWWANTEATRSRDWLLPPIGETVIV